VVARHPATRIGLCGGPGGNNHRRSLGTELKIAGGELAKGPLVLEEYHLAVSLPAQLETQCHLYHVSVAHMLAAGVDPTLAIGAAQADTGLADGRKHGVAVGAVEEGSAFPGVAKGGDGV
jgi:hypothetical protein